MNVKERASIYRFLSLAGIGISAMILSVLLCLIKKLYIDESICIVLFCVFFLAVFILELELQRKRAAIGKNTETSFSKIAIMFVICCFLEFLMNWLPEFYKPVMLIALFMYAVSNELIAYTAVTYFISLYALLFSPGTTELIVLFAMSILSIAVGSALTKPSYRFLSGILLFLFHLILPIFASYWTYHRIHMIQYVYGAVEGFFTAVVVIWFFLHLKEDTANQITINYIDMIQDTYPLVAEVKAFSEIEYQHARKVSDLCYRAAQKLEYDENLCAAAGFYYRLGRWEGEPYIENGIRQAQKYCFPQKLICILGEYYGEVRKPSTRESALVHIVDAIVKKIEVLNEDVTLSDWNRDILIYQSLDDFSSSGLYDESGMSINQFLRLREYLVKEALK